MIRQILEVRHTRRPQLSRCWTMDDSHVRKTMQSKANSEAVRSAKGKSNLMAVISPQDSNSLTCGCERSSQNQGQFTIYPACAADSLPMTQKLPLVSPSVRAR
jgi:hypothetical protein